MADYLEFETTKGIPFVIDIENLDGECIDVVPYESWFMSVFDLAEIVAKVVELRRDGGQ